MPAFSRLPRPTYANVAATIALFVALGGTGYAATTIGTGQIANGAVTTAKLANGAANSSKVANGAVTAAKLANNAVSTARIANAAVTAAKIAPGSLNATLFAAGQTPGINPAKLTVIAGAIVNVPGGGRVGSAIATCPTGQRAISGGFNVGSTAVLEAMGGTPDGTGWTVVAENRSNEPVAIQASAVCAAQ